MGEGGRRKRNLGWRGGAGAERTTRKERRRSLLSSRWRRAGGGRGGGEDRGGRDRRGEDVARMLLSLAGRGDDAATLLVDGGAGCHHVVLQPGESPWSPAEGR